MTYTPSWKMENGSSRPPGVRLLNPRPGPTLTLVGIQKTHCCRWVSSGDPKGNRLTFSEPVTCTLKTSFQVKTALQIATCNSHPCGATVVRFRLASDKKKGPSLQMILFSW